MTETIGVEVAPKVPITRIVPISGWTDLGLREFWSYRELLYFLVWRDIKVRYKQTVIGGLWAILQPVVMMVVFTIFFGRLLGLPSQGIPKPVFYYSGLLPWTFFAGALGATVGTLVDNQRLVTKIYFPRLILPVAALLPGLVDFAISFAILVIIMLIYGLAPTVAFIWLPLFLMMTMACALSVGLWLSVINATYRDVRYVIPFIIQVWFFASPVIYPTSVVPERWQLVQALNPMVGIIDGFRWSLTGVGSPPSQTILVSCVALVVLLVGGIVYFRQKELNIADVL